MVKWLDGNEPSGCDSSDSSQHKTESGMLHSQHEPISNVSRCYFQEIPGWVQMQTDKYIL